MRWKLPNGESLTVAQTSRFQHLRLGTRDLTGVVVASGKKDPVAYEALFAIDPGVRNLGIAFLLRDHLDPKNLRLEFAQQVEFDDDSNIAKVAFLLVRSMDAWLKNWNTYKLRADVKNRLQRVIVVVEQQYLPVGGKGNTMMKSFVDCLETAILSTSSQCEHEFKMIVVSPQSVAKYCGLPPAKKHRVRKAQTKAFVERGFNTQLERHDIADAIALAITALRDGNRGMVRLASVEIGNTDFLFEPPEEVTTEDNVTEAGAKGFLYVSDEDALPNGDDTEQYGLLPEDFQICNDIETGLPASSCQPEEAGEGDGQDAGSACRDDGCPCGFCDDFEDECP
jgi:Holliday junction resolvasome RuvABC endonuclease subunit